VAVQRAARLRRALAIAERLSRKGLGDLTGAVIELGARLSVGRPHIAELLVDRGQARSTDDAFRKHLGSGCIGDVTSEWAALDQVVAWIREAGGSAVIAHPEKYQLTRTRLRELVADFRAAGGAALEVVSGRQPAHESHLLAKLCAETGLAASTGSDFHQPDQFWAELGSQPALPDGCVPVWDRW
jgi:3',5'-nucleoside bisphosphate phosphatase